MKLNSNLDKINFNLFLDFKPSLPDISLSFWEYIVFLIDGLKMRCKRFIETDCWKR